MLKIDFPLFIADISGMGIADLVQDVISDMNGQLYHHLKYVDTFRKVHVGMVNIAGKLKLPVVPFYVTIKDFSTHSVFSTTRYLHVRPPGIGTVFTGRRGSVPSVVSSMAPPSERRGSEPSFLRVNVRSRQDCSRPGLADNASNFQRAVGHVPDNIAEEQSQGKMFAKGQFMKIYCIPQYCI